KTFLGDAAFDAINIYKSLYNKICNYSAAALKVLNNYSSVMLLCLSALFIPITDHNIVFLCIKAL
ncbi:hypothetical protein LJE12_19130, partial [Blautia sp. DFI.6.71]|uniref:hypothetical protein n=1 Tax=Blautia sp. DFI.6.71 TaxID=2885262 RepID=UPI001D09AFF6